MEDPEVNRDYRLVRRNGDQLLFATFVRYEDGSGVVVADGWHTTFELDQTTWRRHWKDLGTRGYVEVSEAVRLGLVSSGELHQGFRPDSELMAAFSQAVSALDFQLDHARPRLVSEGITIEDQCNRTGFDKSGVPYFRWCLRFERRRLCGPEVASALVELSYLEPPEVGGLREIRERCVAEVFQPGQVSRVRHESERLLSYVYVISGDMASLVVQSILRAEDSLPKRT